MHLAMFGQENFKVIWVLWNKHKKCVHITLYLDATVIYKQA